MKWGISNIVFYLALLLVPIFLQVLFLFTEISGSPRQLQDTSELTEASGVLTVCVFPKNIPIFHTGENSVILVGLTNRGESPIQIFGLRGYIYSPNDYKQAVYDFNFHITTWMVPPRYTATFEHMFAISHSVKGGLYNFVGSIIYAIDEDRYQNTFYNDTVYIVKANESIRAADCILSFVVLAMFFTSTCLSAFCIINHSIIKKVKKLQELADSDIPRPRPVPGKSTTEYIGT